MRRKEGSLLAIIRGFHRVKRNPSESDVERIGNYAFAAVVSPEGTSGGFSLAIPNIAATKCEQG